MAPGAVTAVLPGVSHRARHISARSFLLRVHSMNTTTGPRIPFVPADIAEPAEVVAAIRARRGGELLALDRMLLHSPALAAGWNTFLGAVRNGLLVDRRLRELAMCTVAVLNGAEYEYVQHAPLYIAAGASAQQAQALRDPDAARAPAGQRLLRAARAAMRSAPCSSSS